MLCSTIGSTLLRKPRTIRIGYVLAKLSILSSSHRELGWETLGAEHRGFIENESQEPRVRRLDTFKGAS